MSHTKRFEMFQNRQTFQHNEHIPLTRSSYAYVYNCKRELLERVGTLCDTLGIRHTIAHGNLIEWMRGSPIYHDDDLDIRFCIDDFDKWERYCKDNLCNSVPNLEFDDRFANPESQQYNGIQCRLLSSCGRNMYPTMDIHCDLVASRVGHKMWMNYDVDFNKLRRVTYLGVPTWVPSKEDAHNVLCKQYGSDYMIPLHKSPW